LAAALFSAILDVPMSHKDQKLQADGCVKVPKQARSERTRRKLIEAGASLFSRDGYHATSSKKVAREAGVSTGTFYNHFDDKKDLLIEIHRLHARKVHDMIGETLDRDTLDSPGPDGENLGREIVAQSLKLHDMSPQLHREITALAYTDPDFSAMSALEEDRVVEIMVGLLERHREKLRVDDLEAAARVVVHAAEAVVHSIKIFGAPIEEKRLTDALGDMIFRFLYRD